MVSQKELFITALLVWLAVLPDAIPFEWRSEQNLFPDRVGKKVDLFCLPINVSNQIF